MPTAHFGIRKVVFVCSLSVGAAGCLLLTLILEKSSLFVASVWGRLVAYCSRQAHSSVERAGMLAGVTMHQVEPDDDLRSVVQNYSF